MRTRCINNQIIEECTLKEIRDIVDELVDNGGDDDYAVYVEYKDGSNFFQCGGDVDGKYKKNNIKRVVISNPCTWQTYGPYQLRIEDECVFVD